VHAEVCTVRNGRVVVPGLGALLVDVDGPYVDQEANLSLVAQELVLAAALGVRPRGTSVFVQCMACA
jgi:hypothetical protein